MITFRFLLWMIFMAVTLVSTHFQERVFSPYLLLFVALLPVVSLVYDRFAVRKLSLTVQVADEMVQRGQPGIWRIQVDNTDRLRTHFLEYQSNQRSTLFNQISLIRPQETLSLEPGSQASVEIRAQSEHCGILRVPEFSLRFFSVFGLFRPSLSKHMNEGFTPIYVLPFAEEVLTQGDFMGDVLKAGQRASVRSDINRDEIDIVRPMKPAEPRKLIHWKLSARMQSWMIRQYAKAHEKSVVTLIDLPENKTEDDKLLSWRDRLLDRAASQMRNFLLHDFLVQSITFMPEKLVIEGRSLQQFDQLRKQLAMLPRQGGVPLQEQLEAEIGHRRNMVFYVVSHELSHEKVLALRLLTEEAAGVFAEFVLKAEPTAVELDRIKQLRQLGAYAFWMHEEG